MKRLNPIFAAMIVATLIASACSRTTLPSDSDPDDPAPGNNTGTISPAQQGEWAAIEKLEGEAKALARTTGCPSSGDCKSAPVGSRACGGPRYYLPYCPLSTDSVALFAKLAEVAKAEQAYNTKHKLVSTCEFRMPPTVVSVGGTCTAQ